MQTRTNQFFKESYTHDGFSLTSLYPASLCRPPSFLPQKGQETQSFWDPPMMEKARSEKPERSVSSPAHLEKEIRKQSIISNFDFENCVQILSTKKAYNPDPIFLRMN